jgi:hypothetical protein
MSEDLYFARRSFAYGDGAGVELDYGQVVELSGQRNDKKLIEYGHLVKFDSHGGRVKPVECNKCGHRFIDPGVVTTHGRKRHPQRERTEFETLQLLEAEDKRLSTMAPLNETLDSIGGAAQPTIQTAPTAPVARKRGRPKKQASI